jgi:poly-gamma-glutamate system protein
MDGAVLDLVNDPAETGLIGPEFSLITNAQGVLGSKLTTLNPNWAGVIVDYLRRCGLKPGDPVAVALSGSFPGLNISVFAALETLELAPVVITSVGASMWGANDPDFTWLDMERLFAEENIFHIRSAAASYGGGDDMGQACPTAASLRAAIARNGVRLLRRTSGCPSA